MLARTPSELDAGWTTRCGRCADILPDETMSFCPSCGMPFSRVPPTSEFSPLSVRVEQRARQRRFFQVTGASMAVFMAFWILAWGAVHLNNQRDLAQVRSTRELVIYTYDVPGFPALDATSRRAGIAIAVQAFEDHFGIVLGNIQIRENQVPSTLAREFHGKWNERNELLSVWEKDHLLRFAADWDTSLSHPLPIIITNIPVLVDSNSHPGMETRHLSSSGLISGIGSPGFVLVSTYRMLTEKPQFAAAKPKLKSGAERARYLGEYLLAHELGHALLGLGDYVTESPFAGLRSPASAVSTADCLMHTDAGGGFAAWASLRDRHLGQPALCPNYSNTLRAYNLRDQAIAKIRLGDRAAAEQIHLEAEKLIDEDASSWMRELWHAEHRMFLSDFRRWWALDSMLQ